MYIYLHIRFILGNIHLQTATKSKEMPVHSQATYVYTFLEQKWTAHVELLH